jgi:hypothetical protein
MIVLAIFILFAGMGIWIWVQIFKLLGRALRLLGLLAGVVVIKLVAKRHGTSVTSSEAYAALVEALG